MPRRFSETGIDGVHTQPVRAFLVLLLVAILGCGSNDDVDSSVNPTAAVTIERPVLFPDPEVVTPTVELSQPTMVATTGPGVSPFTVSLDLCSDDDGPDCTALRLGDAYLTTEGPARGFLYSCSGPNPDAPGARESEITWIDFAKSTWNFLQKSWLPSGTFDPEPGVYSETIVGKERRITLNNLPVDGMIGDWPMTQYPTLTHIDGNPEIPDAVMSSFVYEINPVVAASPSCLSLGAIGVTTNGVVLYNAADARGEDAVAREIVDFFGGHPAMSTYHYHFIPPRLDTESLDGGHSGIVGYISDGFPIYGYRGENGREMSNDELDECHGHDHGLLGYHYHATIEYPYTVGCYKGTSVEVPRQSKPPRRP